MFVNASGLYLRSTKQNVYDISGDLRKAANFTVDFCSVILTEDLSLKVYVGNTAQGRYYPVMQSLIQLGEQFAYGFCPRTNRLTLYGYSFQGRYDLSNGDSHFSMLMNFDEFSSSSSNTTAVLMKGTYKQQRLLMELFSAAKATSVKFTSDGALAVMGDGSAELWRSQKLPVCR